MHTIKVEFIVMVIMQDSYPESSGTVSAGTLANIPSTLNRWTEEAKVLDGDSVYDCMAGM